MRPVFLRVLFSSRWFRSAISSCIDVSREATGIFHSFEGIGQERVIQGRFFEAFISGAESSPSDISGYSAAEYGAIFVVPVHFITVSFSPLFHADLQVPSSILYQAPHFIPVQAVSFQSPIDLFCR